MSGNIPKTKFVGITVQQPMSDKVVVTYMGGQDSQSFQYGKVRITKDVLGDADVTYDNGDGTDNATLPNRVGSSVTATGTFSQKNHVVVVGYFTDSTEQEIIDTYV
jgi:hypothetical protein